MGALRAIIAVSESTDWYACWDLDDFKANGTEVNDCLGDKISSPTWVSNCTLGEIFNGKGVKLPSITENTPLETLAEWDSSQIVFSVAWSTWWINRNVKLYSPSAYATPSESVKKPWKDIFPGTSNPGCALIIDKNRIVKIDSFFMIISYFKNVIFCL